MSRPPLIQAHPFDVGAWEVDAEFGVFPQGARAKDAVLAPFPSPDNALVGGKRYLFKRSKRSYPDQFWGEIIAYRVGCLMGLEVPPAFAAYSTSTDHSGALIEWFYQDRAEVFVHGGDFVQKIRRGFDRDRGLKHNLQDIETLMRALSRPGLLVQDWRRWWAEALLFDALIGNTDRHQDNWGLVFDSIAQTPPAHGRCRLAPLFDNGTSLGHERFPDRVAQWDDAKLDQYIRRGRHHVNLSLEPGSINGHLDLLDRVLTDWTAILDMRRLRACLGFTSADLTSSLADLVHLQMPVPLSASRMHFVTRLLTRRLTLLTEILDAHVATPR